MFNVHPIDILHVFDNYVWAIAPQENNQVYVVDPGSAEPVLRWMREQSRELAGILITHHHWDHVTGVAELLEHKAVPVWGPAHCIPEITHIVGEGDRVSFDGIELDVMAVPGHTQDHIAYYCAGHPEPALFCGDTLFASGCGRLLGGTAEDLYHSLTRLAQLPPATLVYCAHEYTLANLAFAAAVEPNNPIIPQRKKAVEHLRNQGLPSLPSQLEQELAINPFLRCQAPEVIESTSRRAGKPIEDSLAVFSALRRWKDAF